MLEYLKKHFRYLTKVNIDMRWNECFLYKIIQNNNNYFAFKNLINHALKKKYYF